MKFIERRRQVRADKHKRNLEEQSKDPAGNGWLYDPEDPNVLLILGDTINVADPKGYSLANLERKYAALKRQLAQRYPDFTPGAIKLEVELWHAAVLLADPTLRADLTPLVRTFRSMDCFVPARREITALHTISQMGGDEITSRLLGAVISRATGSSSTDTLIAPVKDSGAATSPTCSPQSLTSERSKGLNLTVLALILSCE